MKHLKKFTAAVLAAAALAALLGANSASATTMEIGGVTRNESISITATSKAGISLVTRDTAGFSQNTCTESRINASTASPYTGGTVTAPVTFLESTQCINGVITVHKGGTLHFAHINGTTNATVSSSGTEITKPTPVGTLTCVTGAGTHIGTLTGVAKTTEHATMDINAVLICSGISARWTGTYTVTSPTGLGVSA